MDDKHASEGFVKKKDFFPPVCSTISTCRRFLPCADTILSRIKSGPWSQMHTHLFMVQKAKLICTIFFIYICTYIIGNYRSLQTYTHTHTFQMCLSTPRVVFFFAPDKKKSLQKPRTFVSLLFESKNPGQRFLVVRIGRKV